MPDPATPNKQAKNFFSLPRELRNEIYSMLWQEKDTNLLDSNNHFTCHIQTTIPALRTANRQFKTEYDARASKLCTLRLEDDNHYAGDALRKHRPRVPRLACKTVTLRTNLRLTDAYTITIISIQDHMMALAHLASQRPCLQSIHIDCTVEDLKRARNAIDSLSAFTVLEQVSDVTIKTVVPKEPPGSGREIVLATWSRAHGLEDKVDEAVRFWKACDEGDYWRAETRYSSDEEDEATFEPEQS
ncbi:hypothetical protein Q7P37_011237 [Cladosporium fusiforme]